MLLKFTSNVGELTILLIALLALLTPLASGGVVGKRETAMGGNSDSEDADIEHNDYTAAAVELEKTLEAPKVTKLVPHAASVAGTGQHYDTKSSGHLKLNRVEMDGESSSRSESHEHQKEKVKNHEQDNSEDNSHNSDSFENESQKEKSQPSQNSLTSNKDHLAASTSLEKSVLKLQAFEGTTITPNASSSKVLNEPPSQVAKEPSKYPSNNSFSANDPKVILNELSSNRPSATSNNLSKHSSDNFALSSASNGRSNIPGAESAHMDSHNFSNKTMQSSTNSPSNNLLQTDLDNESKIHTVNPSKHLFNSETKDPTSSATQSSSNSMENEPTSYASLSTRNNTTNNIPANNPAESSSNSPSKNALNNPLDNTPKNPPSNNPSNTLDTLEMERPRVMRENNQTQIYEDDLQKASTSRLDPIVIKLERPTSNPVSNNEPQSTDVTPIVTIDMNTNGRVESTSMSVLLTTMTTHPANFVKLTAAPMLVTSSTTTAPPTIAKPRFVDATDKHVDESNEIRGNGNENDGDEGKAMGSSEKRAKFINDNSTNTHKMNLPESAEVWTLAGMKPTVIQQHRLTFASTEMPKLATSVHGLNSSHSEKSLLDWTQIMLNNELQNKQTADELIENAAKSTENRTEMQINSTVDATDAEAVDVVTTETVKNTVKIDKSAVLKEETDLNLQNTTDKAENSTVNTVTIEKTAVSSQATEMSIQKLRDQIEKSLQLHSNANSQLSDIIMPDKSAVTQQDRDNLQKPTDKTEKSDSNSQLTDTVMHDKSAAAVTERLDLQKQAETVIDHFQQAGSDINKNNEKLSFVDKGANKTQLETTGVIKEEKQVIKSEEVTTKVSDYSQNANASWNTEVQQNNEASMPLATTTPAPNIMEHSDGNGSKSGEGAAAEKILVTMNNNKNNTTEAREYHTNDAIESDENDDDVVTVNPVGSTVRNNVTHPHQETQNGLTVASSESSLNAAVSMLESSTVNTTRLNGTTHASLSEKLQEENENKTEISNNPRTESALETIKEKNIAGHLGNEVDDEDIKNDKTHLKPDIEKVEDTETTTSAALLKFNTTATTTTTSAIPITTTTQLPLLKTTATGSASTDWPLENISNKINVPETIITTTKPKHQETKEEKQEEIVNKSKSTHETESSIETNIIEPAKTTNPAVFTENSTIKPKPEQPLDEKVTENIVSENANIAVVPITTTMATITANTTTTLEPPLPFTTEAPLINLLDDSTTIKPVSTSTTPTSTELSHKILTTTPVIPSSIATNIEDKYTIFPDTTESLPIPTTLQPNPITHATTPTTFSTITITTTPSSTTMLPTLPSTTTSDPILAQAPTNILTAITGHAGSMNPNSADGGETDVNVIIAITVSVVGVIALILLVAFLFLMRKRQKQMSYGQRCRPVSLDAYSLDNVSVLGSTRRKSASRNSKRSYGNIAFDDPSLRHNLLTAQELGKFVGQRSSIFEEFRDVPQIIARPDEVPAGCEDKNRYANVIPLPETRVILQQQNNDDKTEYINANYVRGPKDTPNYYIACQAPLESTVADFWRMIWEQQSRVIIQATDLIENGIEKCAEYLPPSVTLDNHNTYGDFQVTLKNREIKDKYAISTLMLKNTSTESSRELTHYWYKWPETGVPAEEAPIIAMLLEVRSSLKSYAIEQANDMKENRMSMQTLRVSNADENVDTTPIPEKINEENKEVTTSSLTQVNGEINGNNLSKEKLRAAVRNQGPLTVHCSPGTGRTGTIIACDMAIRSLETPKRSVDVPQVVYYVRRGRASAVQTKEQYEFIYKVANMYATKITNFTHDN